MRSGMILFLTVIRFMCAAQGDTMIWDYTKLQLVNQKYEDGHHIFKKQGVMIKEMDLRNGKADGLLKDYYDNGKPKRIVDIRPFYGFNRCFYAGIYKEYYETGMIKTDGQYEMADSIECIGCYDVDRNILITMANSHAKRVGLWKEYHGNGNLRSEGAYGGIHEIYSVRYPKAPEKKNNGFFYPGDYTEEYLKDQLWKYYNEKGELVKEEYYLRGALCHVKEYER